jgi:hypothetical protein
MFLMFHFLSIRALISSIVNFTIFAAFPSGPPDKATGKLGEGAAGGPVPELSVRCRRGYSHAYSHTVKGRLLGGHKERREGRLEWRPRQRPRCPAAGAAGTGAIAAPPARPPSAPRLLRGCCIEGAAGTVPPQRCGRPPGPRHRAPAAAHRAARAAPIARRRLAPSGPCSQARPPARETTGRCRRTGAAAMGRSDAANTHAPSQTRRLLPTRGHQASRNRCTSGPSCGPGCAPGWAGRTCRLLRVRVHPQHAALAGALRAQGVGDALAVCIMRCHVHRKQACCVAWRGVAVEEASDA